MGYIMPVNNFQYQQYHNRVTKQERDPYPIERLYPIQFGISYQQEKKKEKLENKTNPEENKNTPSTHVTKQQSTTYQLYSEVTGAGRYFQTQV